MHVYVEACNGDHYLGRYEARTNNVNIGISIHFGIITSEPEAIYVTYIPFKAMRGRIQLSLSHFCRKMESPTNQHRPTWY